MNFEGYFVLIVTLFAYSSAQLTIESLHAKLDSLKEKLNHFDILAFALKVTDVDKSLKLLSDRVEFLTQKITKLEGNSRSISTDFRPADQKIEEYNRKFAVSQMSMEVELKQQLRLTESLKPALESGMLKIFSKLDKMHNTLNPVVDDLATVKEKFDFLEASLDVTKLLSKDTQDKVEEFLEKQDGEWTMVQKQLRDIIVKMRPASNERVSKPDHLILDAVTGNNNLIRIRNNLRDLKELEPKMDHFLNVAKHLRTYLEENKTMDGNIRILNINSLNNLESIRDSFVHTLNTLNADFLILQNTDAPEKLTSNLHLEKLTGLLDESFNAIMTKTSDQFGELSNDVASKVITAITIKLTDNFENVQTSLQEIIVKLNICSEEVVRSDEESLGRLNIRARKKNVNKEVTNFLREKFGK